MRILFSAEGVEKFIAFANSSNVGYLQISGGGEPFLEKDAILKCVKEVNAERIILVTSGFWAYSKDQAEEYLNDIYLCCINNLNHPRVTIRVSISKFHSIRLQDKPLVNLISIFEQKYRNIPNFTLQLKFFENDDTLENYLNKWFGGYKLVYVETNGTDDDNIIKVIPWKYILTLKSGYQIIVGKSRIFNPNLRPDICDTNIVSINEAIYDTDLKYSQNNYPSIVHNSNGTLGLDWIVEYNGNVCTWQNRIQDNLLNIYEDDYKTVLGCTLSDLLTYSFIDKGSKYREHIIGEISKRTISLMKSVNIRDYAGTLIFADEKIRLYYNIRVLQDYIEEEFVDEKKLDMLPEELKAAVNMSKAELIERYRKSTYSMLDQELRKPLRDIEFHDFLELVKLGHFEMKKETVERAIDIYNSISTDSPLKSINDVRLTEGMDIERRLTKRLMVRKKIRSESHNVRFYLCRHGETNWNVEGRIKGQIDGLQTEFTQTGINQIVNLVHFLKEEKVEAIFTSDLHRTVESSKLINEILQLPLYYCVNFRGLNMGDFQGQLMTDFLNNESVKRAFIDYDIVIPGGESINQLINRFTNGLDSIKEDYAYDIVAIISHGAAISNIKAKISGQSYEDIDYCVLQFHDGKYEILKYGRY